MPMRLHASRFGLADQKRNVWHVVTPAGQDYSDILRPDYWAHVAAKLRAGDEIIVVNDEMTWRAVLVVRQSAHLWAKVAEISRTELVTADDAAPTSDYQVDVEWGGPHDKHRVVRVRNGQKEVLAKGLDKPEAQKWAEDHLRTIGMKAA